MSKHKVGDHLVVKLRGGRIVDATVKQRVSVAVHICGSLLRRLTDVASLKLWRTRM